MYYMEYSSCKISGVLSLVSFLWPHQNEVSNLALTLFDSMRRVYIIWYVQISEQWLKYQESRVTSNTGFVIK